MNYLVLCVWFSFYCKNSPIHIWKFSFMQQSIFCPYICDCVFGNSCHRIVMWPSIFCKSFIFWLWSELCLRCRLLATWVCLLAATLEFGLNKFARLVTAQCILSCQMFEWNHCWRAAMISRNFLSRLYIFFRFSDSF